MTPREEAVLYAARTLAGEIADTHPANRSAKSAALLGAVEALNQPKPELPADVMSVATPGPYTVRPLGAMWIVCGAEGDLGDIHTVCQIPPCDVHPDRAQADAEAIAAALNAAAIKEMFRTVDDDPSDEGAVDAALDVVPDLRTGDLLVSPVDQVGALATGAIACGPDEIREDPRRGEPEPWPLSVACAICGAPERVWCVFPRVGSNAGYRAISQVHDERRAAAKEA